MNILAHPVRKGDQDRGGVALAAAPSTTGSRAAISLATSAGVKNSGAQRGIRLTAWW
jgi:hypothetical protein